MLIHTHFKNPTREVAVYEEYEYAPDPTMCV